MRTITIAAALACLLASRAHAVEPPTPADPAATGFVLLDKSINGLEGQLDVGMGGDAVGPYAYNAGYTTLSSMGASPGLAMGGGLAGGLVGGAIIAGTLQATRNGEIAAVRNPLNKGALRARIMTTLSESMADAGHPVGRKVVAPDADPRYLRRALGEDKPQTVYMFNGAGNAIVTLSANDRQIVFSTLMSIYTREKNDYALQRKVHVTYLSKRSPEGQKPLDYWSADDASAVLAAVDDGLRRIVRGTVGDGWREPPEVGRETRTTLLVDGKPREFNALALQEDGDFVTLAMRGDALLILPAKPLPPPVAEAPAAPPATAPAGDATLTPAASAEPAPTPH